MDCTLATTGTRPGGDVIAEPQRPRLPLADGSGTFPVRRIYCVGRNYADHIREMGGDERDPPFFFQKPTDAIVLDGSSIDYPSDTDDLQHEVELVLAIGTAGERIGIDAAARHLFGFAVGIDLTRRDRQIEARKAGRPWEIGKSFDHSAPCGALTRCAAAPLPTSDNLCLAVNGTVRQSGKPSQMIWNASELLSRLSRQYRLVPGDLIFTGTPAGVGPVRPGDRLDAWLGDRARLSIHIRSEG